MSEGAHELNKNWLEEARREVGEYVERERREEVETGHFLNENFDVSQISEEDLRMWQKIQDGSLTKEEFSTYNSQFIMGRWDDRVDIEPSRRVFLHFLRNRATGLLLEREYKNHA